MLNKPFSEQKIEPNPDLQFLHRNVIKPLSKLISSYIHKMNQEITLHYHHDSYSNNIHNWQGNFNHG